MNELSAPVRSFLDQLQSAGETLVVEDEGGEIRCGITPYARSTPEQRRAAWHGIESLQAEVGQSLAAQGVTEDDIQRELLTDD